MTPVTLIDGPILHKLPDTLQIHPADSVAVALRPLDRLARTLQSRAPDDLSPLEADIPSEVAGPIGAMNGFTLAELISLIVAFYFAYGPVKRLGNVASRLSMAAPGLAVACLDVLEPDFLDPLIDGPQKNGNFAVQGIEFDAIGRVVAYHLFNEHPGNVNFFRTLKSTSVPADLIAHVYRVDRPGQVRGVSWFAPVVLRLNDFRDFNDAQLVRQKIAACFAAFISGEVDETQLISDETAPSGMTLEGFEPGMIQRLRNGEQVSFSAPPTLDGHESYSSVTLHEIAAGLGVSYEALTGDLKGVNFSSGRMGWLEFQRNIDSWRDKMLKPQLLDRVGLWFIAACRLGEGVNLSPDARVIWSSPRREMISPKDEIPYKVVEVRAGFKSRSQIIREDGFDPAKVDAEIADDNKRQDKLKLILDTDPRQRTAGGNAVTSGADAANGSTSKSSKSGAGSASPADDQKEPADG